MVSISITTQNDYSQPLYVARGGILGISISGTWTGTIELQRLPAEDSMTYPLHSDSFITYLSKTADYDDSLYNLAPGWYRLKATASMTGTAICKIW